ncbi:unnamed protein product [Aphis gossypii]|uniref:Uncharacterized protein n=1 Tax=Aphis gossypii TaxID=80765 RepID=A0A9P0IMH2_APHGO|nr:unnamed protein product [Aphis gossypii]
MSFIVHFIAFVSMTFVVVTSDLQYADTSLECLNQIDIATRPHSERIKFLQEIMETDYLWWPILNERVRVKQITYHNQYMEFNEETMYNEVLALESVSNLLASKAFPASDVNFTMEVIKTATVCSALKHISFQGLMLFQLLHKVTTIEPLEKLLFVMWMVDMVYVVIDKLTTMNDTEPLLLLNSMRVGLIHLHRSILEKVPNLNFEFLHKVGEEMFNEVTKLCVKEAEKDGYYKALVTNLNRTKWVDSLKTHHVLITEYLNDSNDMAEIDTIKLFKGPIDINVNIDVNGIAKLEEGVLKRAYGANFVQSNFLFENLTVHTLIKSQWKTILRSDKRYKVPKNDDSLKDSLEDSPEDSPEDS